MKYLPCLLWVPMAITKLLLMLLGLVVVPVAILTQRMTLQRLPDDETEIRKHWPSVLWLWGNDEEGCPDWWIDKCANLTIEPDDKWHRRLQKRVMRMFPQWWWYAIRNSVNNLRFVFSDKGTWREDSNWPSNWSMEAAVMQREGYEVAYRYRYRGWQSGYRRVWVKAGEDTYSELYVGFKVGSPVPGLGFTVQPRFNRKIGE